MTFLPLEISKRGRQTNTHKHTHTHTRTHTHTHTHTERAEEEREMGEKRNPERSLKPANTSSQELLCQMCHLDETPILRISEIEGESHVIDQLHLQSEMGAK